MLDFDVVKEPWNKYELADGAVVKIKLVVTKVRKEQPTIPAGSTATPANPVANYNFDLQTIAVSMSEEKGTPDTRVYSPQELGAAVIKGDVRYTTVSEEWNEYVTDDGARVRLKVTLTRVSKTSKFDKNGDPIYLVESGVLANVRPPSPS